MFSVTVVRMGLNLPCIPRPIQTPFLYLPESQRVIIGKAVHRWNLKNSIWYVTFVTRPKSIIYVLYFLETESCATAWL